MLEFDPYEPYWDRRVALGESPSNVVREPHRGYYTRGYLPHVDLPLTHFITFRLHDSFPKKLLEEWREELANLDENERRREQYRRTESYVNADHGDCLLRNRNIAGIVEHQLQFHNEVRYRLRAWTIMPNHVHLLATIFDGASLPKVVQSWKARSARKANAILGRRGSFWYRDYYDRYIRDEAHLSNCVRYIDQNPVKAGLCGTPEDWPFGSARHRPLTESTAPSATRRSQ
jgi:REP element-mobilizing transposase RayT